MYSLICIILVVMLQQSKVSGRKNYGMYVWTDGFDRNVPGCDTAEFLNWNSSGSCFTHVWNSPEKRRWLWSTCNLPEREIDAIFVSDVYLNLKAAYTSANCGSSDIYIVKDMLTEGHTKVQNLKIYGLYAASDIEVSEKDMVKYIVYYNDECAASAVERFDGVATNNEAYTPIKCGDMNARLLYLDNLQQIVTEAAKQVNGQLLTHYSMSWHWGRCDGSQDMMTWNGKTVDVNHHMIDIFDSTDVQVGFIISSEIANRMKIAGIEYAESLNKPIFATVYLNKVSPCQITFFPDDTCHISVHTEAGMYAAFDSFTANDIAYARPCIHYFRGVYSTGVHQDWPLHDKICTNKRNRVIPQLLNIP